MDISTRVSGWLTSECKRPEQGAGCHVVVSGSSAGLRGGANDKTGVGERKRQGGEEEKARLETSTKKRELGQKWYGIVMVWCCCMYRLADEIRMRNESKKKIKEAASTR